MCAWFSGKSMQGFSWKSALFWGVLPVLFSKAFEMKWTSVEKIAQDSAWIGKILSLVLWRKDFICVSKDFYALFLSELSLGSTK